VKTVLALIAAILLAGCNKSIDTKEAVREGVLEYLNSRSNLNLGSMNVDVSSVSFSKNEADAMVSFTAKGSSGGGAMNMRYTLERKGAKWAVKEKAQTSENPHGAGVPQPGPGGEAGAMPPGHPPVSGDAKK